MSQPSNPTERERQIQALLDDGLTRDEAEFALDHEDELARLPGTGEPDDGPIVDP